MSEEFNSLFRQLLDGLKTAEKRHRVAYGEASDNSEWDVADKESATALRITNWRRALEALREEVAESSAVSDEDVSGKAPLLPSRIADGQFRQSVSQKNKPGIVALSEILTAPAPQQPADGMGAKPKSLKLLGKKYSVNAWDDLYVKVCEILLLHRPYLMAMLDQDKEFNSEAQISFSYQKSDIKTNQKRLPNGLWVEKIKDPADVMRICRRLLEMCGFSPDELYVETVGG